MPKHTFESQDRISYDPPFDQNVQGRAYARFRLGPDGQPEYEEDRDGLRHYPISVYLHSPRAREIDEVTYIMDDPSYYDPIGRSTDRANDFREEIWSYGDVPVVVKVRIADDKYEQRAWLSQMLDNGHQKDTNMAIRSAIQRI